MAFCKTCGSQISDQTVTCPVCGTMVSAPVYNAPRPASSGNFLWAVLGFFFPLVGLILFIVWRNEKPGDSKMAGIGALVGFILGVIGNIIFSVVYAAIMSNLVEDVMNSGYYYY